jgi:hypothetical protein
MSEVVVGRILAGHWAIPRIRKVPNSRRYGVGTLTHNSEGKKQPDLQQDAESEALWVGLLTQNNDVLGTAPNPA